MKKGLLIALGAVGLLGLLSASSKAATVPLAPPPTPPPPPPPPPPTSPKPSKPKVKPPAAPPGPLGTIDTGVVPEGWIAAMPTAELQKVANDIQGTLGASPVGTSFPFLIGDKKYLAKIISDPNSSTGKTVAILQPEFQI